MDALTQEFLAESQDGLDRMERCLTELERHPGDRELVAEVFRVLHTMKGSTGFLGFARLERMTHAGESLLQAVRDGRVAVSNGLVTVLLTLVDELRGVLRTVTLSGGEGQQGEAEIRRLLEDLEVAGRQEVSEAVGAEDERQAVWEPERSLRVEAEVLNRMMNLVGDLVLTRNRLMHVEAGDEVRELAMRLDCVTAELRETVMRARLQPMGQLFARLPRMVRELARECGKRVRVECEGSQTGVDKGLLETMKEALTHVVRNAIDHGLEEPEVRRAAGKQAEGLVRLRAVEGHGWISIEVRDDGRGMDPARICAVAVKRGVVTAERAAEMGVEETLQMVFLPGFSTAPEVTRISGRGVGMDVVRTSVEAVGGSVEVESEVGVGTTVRMKLPVSVAILSALVVRVAGERFCVAQNVLAELVWVEDRSRLERMGDAFVYRLRDKMLPVVCLGEMLELGAMEEGRGFYLAVMEADGFRMGLAVEEIEAPEEIVVKPLAPSLREIEIYTGAAVLGCGELAMILNVGALAMRAGISGHRHEAAAGRVGAKFEEERPEFLVFEGGRTGARMGIALSEVDGVVQVRTDQMERVGEARFWQDASGLVQMDGDGVGQGERPEWTVVVRKSRAGETRRGYAVDGSLDLMAGLAAKGGQVAVIDGRVTALAGVQG